MALFVGLIVWVILIEIGLADESSTAWIELWLGLGIVKCRVETQREAPTILVGRPAGLGGREREARMGESFAEGERKKMEVR